MERRRAFQFLMGLRDTYAQPRSNLLLKANLPSVKGTYGLLIQDETQRSVNFLNMQAYSIALQTATRGDFATNCPPTLQHASTDVTHIGQFSVPSQTIGQTLGTIANSFVNVAHQSSTRPGHNRTRPRRTHCGLLGHTQQECYKLHGYPPGHKHYKKGNTNSTPSATPSATTDSIAL